MRYEPGTTGRTRGHRLIIQRISEGIGEGELTTEEAISDLLSDYMAKEPDPFVPLGDMHREWITTIEGSERTGLLVSRGHLKTSFALSYLIKHMVAIPNFRALYIGSALTSVMDKLMQFEEILKRSWRYEHLIPTTSDFRWTLTNKQLTNGARVRGAYVGGPLEGPHVHMILIDDPLQEFPKISDENLILWINTVVLPMRLPGAKIIVTMTRKRNNDLADALLANPAWTTILHTATLHGTLLDDDTPRWPEYWTMEMFRNEKEAMGTAAFMREYMLKPLDPAMAIIPWAVIEPALDTGRCVLMEAGNENKIDVVMGVDLAYGQTGAHDKTAYCIVAYNRTTRKRTVLYCWSGRIHAEGEAWMKEQIDRLIFYYNKFRPSTIMIESNGFQAVMAHAAADIDFLPVETHVTGIERRHARTGIPGIGYQMEAGRYVIPWDDAAQMSGAPGMRHLVQGLSDLASDGKGGIQGHVADEAIALWMCEIAIQELTATTYNVASIELLPPSSLRGVDVTGLLL